MRKTALIPILLCLLPTFPARPGLIVGTPTPSGEGNGATIPGFILPPAPTNGTWFITNLDFIALNSIYLSINTDNSPANVSYSVNANITNNSGGMFDSILVELKGETDGLTLTEPLFNGNQTAGVILTDQSFMFEGINLADSASNVSSWKLNIGPNLPAQSFSLVITPIPEPSTALLLIASSACLLRRRNRRLSIG